MTNSKVLRPEATPRQPSSCLGTRSSHDTLSAPWNYDLANRAGVIAELRMADGMKDQTELESIRLQSHLEHFQSESPAPVVSEL